MTLLHRRQKEGSRDNPSSTSEDHREHGKRIRIKVLIVFGIAVAVFAATVCLLPKSVGVLWLATIKHHIHYHGQQLGVAGFVRMPLPSRRELLDLQQGIPSQRDALLIRQHVKLLQRDLQIQWTNERTIILLWTHKVNVWFALVPQGAAEGCNIPCEWTRDRDRFNEATGLALMLDRGAEEDPLPATLRPDVPVIGITWENNMAVQMSGSTGLTYNTMVPEQLRLAQGALPYTHIASYELDAHIPIIYPEMRKFVEQYQPRSKQELLLDFDGRDAALYLAISNCQAPIVPNRLDFAQRVAMHFPVHSYGKCLSDPEYRVQSASGHTDPVHVQHMGKYMFVFASENSYGLHYVTEKLWNALQSGAIPIYLGAPNVLSFLPDRNAAIHVSDFENPEELAGYLKSLATNHSKLFSHLKWRMMPSLPTHIHEMAKHLIDGDGPNSFACKACNCARHKIGCSPTGLL